MKGIVKPVNATLQKYNLNYEQYLAYLELQRKSYIPQQLVTGNKV